MNERILSPQLLKLVQAAGPGYSQADPEWVKKFAELIIQECAEQIKTHGISSSSEGYGDYEIGFNAGLFHAFRTTKEHFGVE